MRSLIAFVTAGWFGLAAWNLNGAYPPGQYDQTRTLFVGLAGLALALVDWPGVLEFLTGSASPQPVTPGEKPPDAAR